MGEAGIQSGGGGERGGLRLLPLRPANLHKGTAGSVMVVGGSCVGDSRMIGAPALAAAGALRAGCGLARVLVPAPMVNEVLSITPSATGIALEVDSHGGVLASKGAEVFDAALMAADAVVIGPGLGNGPGSEALSLRAVQQEDVPVVVDADALNVLAEVPELWRDWRALAVITPHPGEYRRLAMRLGIERDPVDPSQRMWAAEELAQRLGCVVVLKGQASVVSNGLESWVCERGHPCMATAGTGDVLAGVIGGLLAQYAKQGFSIFELAKIGVEAHARAGEAWAKEHKASAGLLAMELADLMPGVLEEMRGK